MKYKLIIQEAVISSKDEIPMEAFISEIDMDDLKYQLIPLSNNPNFTIIQLFKEIDDQDETDYISRFLPILLLHILLQFEVN